MADIPGFKAVRLLAQQPVPILDLVRMTAVGPQRLENKYAMELQFEDGSVVNVPLTEKLHNEIRYRMVHQDGVGLEERMAARGGLATPGEAKLVNEELLPLDASGQEVYAALKRVVDEPATRPDLPALPTKKE